MKSSEPSALAAAVAWSPDVSHSLHSLADGVLEGRPAHRQKGVAPLLSDGFVADAGVGISPAAAAAPSSLNILSNWACISGLGEEGHM